MQKHDTLLLGDHSSFQAEGEFGQQLLHHVQYMTPTPSHFGIVSKPAGLSLRASEAMLQTPFTSTRHAPSHRVQNDWERGQFPPGPHSSALNSSGGTLEESKHNPQTTRR